MNKLNKGKKIGIVSACLASVALIGVGFSSWVIGFQNKETNGEVTVSADDVKYKALTLSAEVAKNNTLYLAGKSASSTTNGPISFERGNDNKEEDLSVSVTFTITVGKDFTVSDLQSISFTFDNDSKYVDNAVATEGNKLTSIHTGNNLTYLEAPETISNLNFNDTTSSEGFNLDQSTKDSNLKKYTMTKTLDFHWGTFFKTSTVAGSYGVNPVDYYASVLTGESLTEQNIQSAGEELEAMKTKYDGTKKINLKMTLGIKDSSQGN